VQRLHGAEVAVVQGGELGLPQALDDGEHSGVDEADVLIGILIYELGNTDVVLESKSFNAVDATDYVTHEEAQVLWPEPLMYPIVQFNQHGSRNDQRLTGVSKELARGLMIRIGLIEEGE
jgi:hypothetical protein